MLVLEGVRVFGFVSAEGLELVLELLSGRPTRLGFEVLTPSLVPGRVLTLLGFVCVLLGRSLVDALVFGLAVGRVSAVTPALELGETISAGRSFFVRSNLLV